MRFFKGAMKPGFWLALVLCGCFQGVHADVPLRKANFIPLWSPQAQFAGYYVAMEKGIYRRHGIDLTIIPGGPGRSPADFMQDGRADFGVLWLTTALQRRDQGLPLVNVAQIIQQSSMLLVARKASGIRSVADLAGQKVGLWGGDFSIPPNAFFHRHGLQVKPVHQSATVNLFLRGGVGVVSAMWYNEYHTLLNAGLDPDELTLFPLKDHGANFPEDGLYTLETTLQRDPQLVDAFVRASLEGWDHAFTHPEEALDIVLRVMRDARIPANRMHQKWMLARMRDLIRPGGSQRGAGSLGAADYRTVSGELARMALIRRPVDYGTFVGGRNALP